MQTLTEKVLKLDPPGGFFDWTVVRNLFADSSEGARKALMHRAVRSGEVLRLKPGLYCLDAPLRRSHPHPFVLAGLICYPSHISLESALSYHGLIPEAVYGVTSVTVKRRRSYDTPLGVFSYSTVPSFPPRAGVELVDMGQAERAFLAHPLRAIADLVYLRKKVTWKSDGILFLVDSMRMEFEDLTNLLADGATNSSGNTLGDIWEDILAAFHDRRTRKYLEGMRKAIESETKPQEQGKWEQGK